MTTYEFTLVQVYNQQAQLQLAYIGQIENIGLPAICTF
jgi:hypothetical protein